MTGATRQTGLRGRGFSLIELLVALAIAALLVATAVSAVSASMAALARADGSVEAAIIARARLAEAELEPFEGERDGEVQVNGRRYRWQVSSVPFLLPVAGRARKPALRLLQTTVAIDWSEGGTARGLSASTLLFAATEARR